MSCDVTGGGGTYSSILSVHVVSAGMVTSGCLKAGELLLGSREGVHLDSGNSVRIDDASSHHNPVLEFNGTSITANEDSNNINIYSD